MSAGRRGRPYQVPEDRTSLRASTVDVDARVGWLLLMSRLHQRNSELALGGPFMAALSDIGLQADRSAVSRWESGKMQPRFSVLTAYERVLDLPPGQLSSVVNALRRAYSPEPQRAWAPVLDPHSDAFHLRLDYLLDVLRSDKATGPDWTEFGYYVSAPDMLYLHGSVWHDLTYRLIDEMARSIGLAYLQRFETIRILLEHRIASSWLLRAAGDYISDPCVQIVNDPVGVLEISPSAEAAAVLLEKFVQTESDAVFEATVPAVAYKVGNGQYSKNDIERVEATLLRAIRQRPREISGLEELLVAMPEASQQRLMDAARGLRGHQELAALVAHGEWTRPDLAKRVSQQIADDVRSRLPSAALYDEDPMTPRIIREALFSLRGAHRHLSSLLLLGSPFRKPLASALAAHVDAAELEPAILERMVRLLRYVAGPEQEVTLLNWFSTAETPMASSIALALGHLAFGNVPSSPSGLSSLVGRLGESDALDRAILYALGMRGDETLVALAKDDSIPVLTRDSASWWVRQGGAVFE